ncbi:MAG TPA: hypothetical protein VGC21_13390 [Telluria sp.]|jgi:hypothetical protein
MLPFRPALTALLCAACASAMGAPPPRQPDPRDAAAPVPPVAYASAFDGYQADRPLKVDNWQQTNAAISRPAGQAMQKTTGENQPADPHAGHRH